MAELDEGDCAAGVDEDVCLEVGELAIADGESRAVADPVRLGTIGTCTIGLRDELLYPELVGGKDEIVVAELSADCFGGMEIISS